jgi:hypothetical protein
MQGVLEIIQVDSEEEPSFEVWLRRIVLVPSGDGGQSGGLSHPRRMSHLAGNRHHDLLGERRTARASPSRWPAMSLRGQPNFTTRKAKSANTSPPQAGSPPVQIVAT